MPQSHRLPQHVWLPCKFRWPLPLRAGCTSANSKAILGLAWLGLACWALVMFRFLISDNAIMSMRLAQALRGLSYIVLPLDVTFAAIGRLRDRAKAICPPLPLSS